MVRLHSECLTGDIFASQRCDCGPQLHQAMRRINETGRGVCVYLRGHEGRGIGLGSKLQAYNLQDMGRDTVQANLDLGFAADSRDYTVGAQILRDLGVQSVTLLTNNPAKMDSLRSFGFDVIGRSPVICPINPVSGLWPHGVGPLVIVSPSGRGVACFPQIYDHKLPVGSCACSLYRAL